MSSQKFERLRKLREELEKISVETYEDWSNVESWFRKAEPTIENEWVKHLSKFQNSISRSRFWTYRYGLYRPISMNQREDKRIKLQEAPKRDAEEAQKAKQEILEIIEGLLLLPETVDEQSNQTISDTNQAQSNTISGNPLKIIENPPHTFPKWLFYILAIVFVFSGIIVAMIQYGLPLIFSQNANTANKNTNITVNSTTPTPTPNPSPSLSVNISPPQLTWITKLDSGDDSAKAEENKKRFLSDYKNLSIFLNKGDDKKPHYYVVSVYDNGSDENQNKTAAEAGASAAHANWERLKYEKKYKESAVALNLKSWCGTYVLSRDEDYSICEKSK